MVYTCLYHPCRVRYGMIALLSFYWHDQFDVVRLNVYRTYPETAPRITATGAGKVAHVVGDLFDAWPGLAVSYELLTLVDRSLHFGLTSKKSND